MYVLNPSYLLNALRLNSWRHQVAQRTAQTISPCLETGFIRPSVSKDIERMKVIGLKACRPGASRTTADYTEACYIRVRKRELQLHLHNKAQKRRIAERHT